MHHVLSALVLVLYSACWKTDVLAHTDSLEPIGAFIRGVQGEDAADVACGWPNAVEECERRLVELRPGQSYVVDDFLSERDLSKLNDIYSKESLKSSPWRRKSNLNTSYAILTSAPLELADYVTKLTQRIHGHVVKRIHTAGSMLPVGDWSYRGNYFLDYWDFRRYTASHRVPPHPDTGSYSRCLAVGLHLGKPGAVLGGGALQTSLCKKGDCNMYGWDYFQDANREKYEALMTDDNMVFQSEVPFKPGRLVVWLGETLHSVSAFQADARDIMFLWFTCKPTLLNGVVSTGNLPYVKLLVKQRADVQAMKPSNRRSVLHVAAMSSSETAADVISFLISTRADVTARDKAGNTPLHYAMYAGASSSSIESLVSSGADMDGHKNIGGLTPQDFGLLRKKAVEEL